MTSLTLEALTPAQRTALAGPALATPDALAGLAARFRALRTKARLFDKPALAHALGGYARLAADLAAYAQDDRWDVANPDATVPAALLAPDGRYSCDGCEGLVERAALVTFPHGFYCSECASRQ